MPYKSWSLLYPKMLPLFSQDISHKRSQMLKDSQELIRQAHLLSTGSKILKFDYRLTIFDFLPNTTDFQSSDQLIEQNCDLRLETWHEYSWRPIMNHDSILRLIVLGGGFVWSILSQLEQLRTSKSMFLCKNGRANFGVQQLPLFNLFKPEDLDWLVCLS